MWRDGFPVWIDTHTSIPNTVNAARQQEATNPIPSNTMANRRLLAAANARAYGTATLISADAMAGAAVPIRVRIIPGNTGTLR